MTRQQQLFIGGGNKGRPPIKTSQRNAIVALHSYSDCTYTYIHTYTHTLLTLLAYTEASQQLPEAQPSRQQRKMPENKEEGNQRLCVRRRHLFPGGRRGKGGRR